MSISEKTTNLQFPDYFDAELQHSNVIKGEDAPVTVVLIAEDIGKNECCQIQPMILEIAKIHKIAIKTLNQNKDIDQKLAEVEKEMRQSAHLLFIIGHGTPHSIRIGKENPLGGNPHSPDPTLYQVDDVSEEDFSHLKPDAKIILFSCNTGKHVKEGNLAQKIAAVANRTVLAPIQNLYATKTCLVEKPKEASFEIRSFDTDHNNMICTFKSDGTFELDPVSLKDEQHKFSDMVKYTEKHALEGDPDAELIMASFYEFGHPGIDQSPEQALHYYNLAAEHGNADAQYRMGTAYLRGQWGTTQSDAKAFHWFKKAADQQHADAAFVVGQLYEKSIGVDKSPRSALYSQSALYYYNLAAERGNAGAQYKIGLAYLQGNWGLTQSNDYAFQYLETAAKNGDASAQYEIGVAYLEGKWGLSPSKQDAEAWLIKAAHQNHEQAILLLAK